MTIWASEGLNRGDKREIIALGGDSDAAKYRGEGEPTTFVDVGTATNYHQLVRLCLFSADQPYTVDAEALLTPDQVGVLIEWLIGARERALRDGYVPPVSREETPDAR